MAERFGPGTTVCGVDLDEALVAEASARARAEGADGVAFRTADVTALPFDNSTFDACRADRVVVHVAGAARAVHELARVCRGGGTVFVSDPGAWRRGCRRGLLEGSPQPRLQRRDPELPAGLRGQQPRRRDREARAVGGTGSRRILRGRPGRRQAGEGGGRPGAPDRSLRPGGAGWDGAERRARGPRRPDRRLRAGQRTGSGYRHRPSRDVPPPSRRAPHSETSDGRTAAPCGAGDPCVS